MNEYTVAKLVIDGKLRSHYIDFMEICVIDNGYYIDTPEGHGTVISRPLTVAEVVGFIFRKSDVEQFEKKHGIGPNALPIDLPQKGLTENPVAAHAQDKMDEVKVTPPHPPKPAYFFTRESGGIWHVWFEGETARIKHLNGIQYIAILLERPGTSVSCSDLYQAVSGKTPEKIMTEGAAIDEGLNIGSSKQAVSDRKTRKICSDKYNELKESLTLVNDIEKREEIETQMKTLMPYLTRINIPDANDKKVQVNIGKRLYTAYKAIGKAGMKELVKHLQTHIKPDGAFGLYYTGSITWEITIK